MNKTHFLILIMVGALVAFLGYCALLINWIQDYTSGTYLHNHMEAIIESGALLLYTFAGVKFFYRHVNSMR